MLAERDKPDAEQQGPRMPPTSGAFHTFVGLDTKRDEKVVKRAVHATAPDVPQWLNWSEQAITWTCQDHPPRVDYPGKFALVVALQVKGYILTKTLMDGGRSINILYYETFRRMNLCDSALQPSVTTFHAIVPERKAH